MEPLPLTARRATLDDLSSLLQLWNGVGLPGQQLEKYLTEFQVVAGEDGDILAAVGLLVEGHEGLVHSEAVASEETADECRQSLWQRLQMVAKNQGVHRLWTQEDAPYWQSVFAKASPFDVSGLNASFADSNAVWWVADVANHSRKSGLVEEQLAIWEATRTKERADFERTIQNTRTIALAITGVVIAVCAFLVIYVLLRRPDLIQRLLGR